MAEHPSIAAEREALRQRRERHVAVAREQDIQFARLHVAVAHLRAWDLADKEVEGD